MKHNIRGFTLTEILIVVAIVAILSAIAIPAYQDQGFKARRSDAVAALEKAAARQEQFYFQFNNYATVVSAIGGTTSLTSPEGYYDITVSTPSPYQSYTLTATPVTGGPQASDADCATLVLDNLGRKTSTGNATANVCWKKN